jgi:hypothetical protein
MLFSFLSACISHIFFIEFFIQLEEKDLSGDGAVLLKGQVCVFQHDILISISRSLNLSDINTHGLADVSGLLWNNQAASWLTRLSQSKELNWCVAPCHDITTYTRAKYVLGSRLP